MRDTRGDRKVGVGAGAVRSVGTRAANVMKRGRYAATEGALARDAGAGTASVAVSNRPAETASVGASDAGAGAASVGVSNAGAKRLPRLRGAASRLRRAAQLPGIRCVGNAGGKQHRQVNRPKNQCYRESLSWGYVRKRKCNHL